MVECSCNYQHEIVNTRNEDRLKRSSGGRSTATGMMRIYICVTNIGLLAEAVS